MTQIKRKSKIFFSEIFKFCRDDFFINSSQISFVLNRAISKCNLIIHSEHTNRMTYFSKTQHKIKMDTSFHFIFKRVRNI